MRPDPATSDGERSAARRGAGPGHRRTQRGAALLVAMIILTLVSTLAAGMIWQQWRALQVESAERARSQAAWIVTGALDWGRLILREDRTAQVDHLGEVWATPLAEARLSTFLAVDREHTTASGPEAFLSGSIRDAQSRYNLRNLVVDGKLVPEEAAVLRKLCETAGVGADTAELIAAGLVAASQPGNSQAIAHASIVIAHHDERTKAEAPAALHHFGDAVDVDHFFFELDPLDLDAVSATANCHSQSPQNFRPAARAPSATSFTRPWYRKPLRSNTTSMILLSWHSFAILSPIRRAAARFPVLPVSSPSVDAAAMVRPVSSEIT
jgi:hypothetical protein